MGIESCYEIILYWSNEDRAVIAEVPELPGCAADGATYAEALENAQVIIHQWLETARETDREIPEFLGSTTGPWQRYLDTATLDDRGIGTVRYPRIVPKDEECARLLKKRTLTNLYNERPTWLNLAQKLDEAVFAAYGWNSEMTDDDLLAALLALNLERAAA